jgi:sterol 24-C-methyltransferase
MNSLTTIINKIKIPHNMDEFLKNDRESQVVTVAVAGVGLVVAVKTVNYLFGTDPLGRTAELFGKFSRQEKSRNIKVDNWIDTYNNLHDDSKAGKEGRNSAYSTLVNAYYELATSFYEWGWGQSFHFAYQLPGETFQQAIQRHEYYLAGRLGVSTGEKVLDCGCGIGGPMRNIARFTNAHIDGVTLSEVSYL